MTQGRLLHSNIMDCVTQYIGDMENILLPPCGPLLTLFNRSQLIVKAFDGLAADTLKLFREESIDNGKVKDHE
jgi:hypothetical protein